MSQLGRLLLSSQNKRLPKLLAIDFINEMKDMLKLLDNAVYLFVCVLIFYAVTRNVNLSRYLP